MLVRRETANITDGQMVEHKLCPFTGSGYRTLGDAWLAESAGARAREHRGGFGLSNRVRGG
jgi:hypothetical protein